MPRYDFSCSGCGKMLELYAAIEEREKICECGTIMKRLITTRYYAQGDMAPYFDEHIGDKPMWVTSRRHRRELLKKYRLYEAG